MKGGGAMFHFVDSFRGGQRDRRQFLRDAGLATLPFLIGGRLLGDAPRPGALIVRDPNNLEFPFDSLDSFLTPNDRFYVRNHFAVPAIKASEWRLRVEGAVE